nr:hypothetical protein StreXyl84_48410 [Streptomyces sp. Xyl84]
MPASVTQTYECRCGGEGWDAVTCWINGAPGAAGWRRWTTDDPPMMRVRGRGRTRISRDRRSPAAADKGRRRGAADTVNQ